MNNKDTVEASLPRHLACWLLVHCDKTLAQLTDCLSRCDSDDLLEWCLAEMKCFKNLFGRLKHCVSKREILAFLDKQ